MASTRDLESQAENDRSQIAATLDELPAFFTFFIPVSLFDSESRFFAPTHTCWKSARAGGCQGRPSLCADLTLHRFQAEP